MVQLAVPYRKGVIGWWREDRRNDVDMVGACGVVQEAHLAALKMAKGASTEDASVEAGRAIIGTDMEAATAKLLADHKGEKQSLILPLDCMHVSSVHGRSEQDKLCHCA